jgi:hypothetical protein
MKYWIVGGLVVCLLVACTDGESFRIGTQQWKDVQIVVESRPSPPEAGMNEFLVIASKGRGLPEYELIVSLRTNEQESWKQCIQDGHVGVYRRAIRVANPDQDVLEVSIQRGEEEGILQFPLIQTSK